MTIEEVDISQEQLDDYLAHFGVKGMQWGVRKDKGSMSRSDRKWAEKSTSNVAKAKLATLTSASARPEIDALQAKPAYAKLTYDERWGSSPKARKFQTEVQGVLEKHINQHAKEQYGDISPTGRFELKLNVIPLKDGGGVHYQINELAMGHVDEVPPRLRMVLGELGEIVGIEVDRGVEMIQSDPLEAVLSHYGIKGQKWGVRRSEKQLARSRSEITKFKDKPKNLTDAELAARIKRLEQEKRYRDLNKRDISTGRKHINEVLIRIGKETVAKAGTQASYYGVKKLIEKKFPKIDAKEMFPKPK